MENEILIITPKALKGEDGFKTFSIRVKENLVMQLDLMSQKTGRSRNELISILIEYALHNCIVSETSETKSP